LFWYFQYKLFHFQSAVQTIILFVHFGRPKIIKLSHLFSFATYYFNGN